MKITPGTSDVTVYFKLIDPTSGTPETGLTIADLDLTYVRDRASAVKSDLSTPGGFAVDSAHTDNAAIQVDATNCPGLYRVDVPDAAFLAGVSRVQLCVNGAAIDPAYIEVELETQQTGDAYAQIGIAGAGLTALGDVRLANLDAAISTIPTAAEIDTQLSGTHGAGAWGAGTGASSKTYTVTDTGTGLPLAGVYCRLTTDVSGLVQVDAGTTTAAGQVIFHHDLAAGTTVYVWRSKTGYEFTDPDTETI